MKTNQKATLIELGLEKLSTVLHYHRLATGFKESIGLLEWNLISLHFKVWLNLFKQRIVATKFLETKTAARSVHKWIVKLVS
ncbi:hypothetical protein HDU83_008129 [Entophlyctis luteolus]|nr:hypothetical protein HDU83_008129 [Entophlyctis luteolus]